MTKDTPEHLALRRTLEHTEKMQRLSVNILRQERMTQDFVRGAFEALIESYFNLESMAMESAARNRNYAAEIHELRNEVNMQRYKLLNLAAEQPPQTDSDSPAAL